MNPKATKAECEKNIDNNLMCHNRIEYEDSFKDNLINCVYYNINNNFFTFDP
jgi:hypothetical protein